MVPKANPGDTGSDPVTTGFTAPNYWAPDWVLITRSGPTEFGSWQSDLADSTPENMNFVVGRYAFAIYDEGGLLDANLVGWPSPTPGVTDIGRKGNIAFADLTAMKYTPSGATASVSTISKIVGWRNYATVQSSGSFPSLSPTPNPSLFVNYFLDTTRDFRTVASTLYLGRTDQAFLNRKELIEFFRAAGPSFNMLQLLGTFSRENNLPTFQAGSASLKSRFALGNLGLIRDNPDPANKANILKYFGLRWVAGADGTSGTPPTPATPGHWQYVGQNDSGLQSSIPAFTTDPEFFQLLNYAFHSTNSDDSSHIASTLAIGASLIDQYDDDSSVDPTTSSTSTMIEYNGGWAVGMENLDPARSSTPAPAGMSPTPLPTVTPYPMLNRPFRNVGEFGYAYKGSGTQTVDFDTPTSSDGPILDLFSYNTAPVRAGIVSLNTANPGVIAAILKGAIRTESSSSTVAQSAANNAAASPTPNATTGVIGHSTLGTLVSPAIGKSEIARLTAAAGATLGSSDENKETAARALSEVTQTRTWGLFIDVIAQSGRYPSAAAALKDFVVEGEKRYWLHVAIDRFSGAIVDQQLEAAEE
jgi:hypothetical protein